MENDKNSNTNRDSIVNVAPDVFIPENEPAVSIFFFSFYVNFLYDIFIYFSNL